MSEETKYDIQFLSSAAKEFRNLPPDIKKRIVIKIDNLAINPLPGNVKKLRGKNYYIGVIRFQRAFLQIYKIIFWASNSNQ